MTGASWAGLVMALQICEGLILDRDLNAAINIVKEALRTTGSSSGSDACGESSSGLVNGQGETALVEAGTKGDICGLSQMSMF
jgi:hypothetical protein